MAKPGLAHQRNEFLRQPLHDGTRHGRRADDAEPVGRAEIRDPCLFHGGQVRQRRRALRRGYCDRTHGARADLREVARDQVEDEVQVALHHVLQRGRRTLVDDVLELGAGALLEELLDQDRARARGAVVQRAGLLLRQCHQFGHRPHAQLRAHHQHIGKDADQRDAGEIRRLVVDVLEEEVVQHQQPGRAHHERVAVRFFLRNVARRDPPRSAGAVLHDELHLHPVRQSLRQQAGDDVVRPARREPDHELDGPLRPFVGMAAASAKGEAEQEAQCGNAISHGRLRKVMWVSLIRQPASHATVFPA